MPDQESVSSTADGTAPPPIEAGTDLSEKPSKPEKLSNVAFSIWPPTQNTRDAVINRVVETLSTPSVVSKRYGIIPPEEADYIARLIEEEAYSAAVASSSAEDDGLAIVQSYSCEISKRMLEAVKARTAPRSAADSSNTGSDQGSASAPAIEHES